MKSNVEKKKLTKSLPGDDDHIGLQHNLWRVLAEGLDALEGSELGVFALDEVVSLVDRPQGDEGMSEVEFCCFAVVWFASISMMMMDQIKLTL